MTKKYIFLIFILFGSGAFNPAFVQNITDTTSVEYLMFKGNEAYTNGYFEKSNNYFEKVLMINENNYDAKYAIATNYYRLKEYNNSLKIYNSLYAETPQNTDVINGMARCYIKLESYNKAMELVKISITLNNKDISAYNDLAFLYILNGELDSAKHMFNEIIKIDSTNAEAYAGIGKMYYWQDMPATALLHYKKAFQFDPENPEIKNKIEIIKNELSYSASLTVMNITEEESSYKIDAFVQKYGLEKRINDYLTVSLYSLWDYSNRNNLYYDDINRWYDNTWVKSTIIYKSQRLSFFTGASSNDSRITSYGATWSSAFNIKKIKIKNYLTAAYDYFYYWNKVGQTFYQNTLGITYKKISFSGTYKYGIIKDNYVWDFDNKTDNPNTRYNLELKYTLTKNPKITVGVNRFNMNYKYASPLYYSPENRTINGFSISNYFKFKKFYTFQEFLYGQDSEKVEQSSGSIDFGYDTGKLSFGIGGNFFTNDFYKSKNISISIKKTF